MQLDDTQVAPDKQPSADSTRKRLGFPELRFRLFAWGYAFILTMISRIWTIRDPGPADAELFAYIGREWRRGEIPYKQIWDNKPPGIFAVNALAAIFHRQFVGLAVFEFISLFATIILIYLILSDLDCSPYVRWSAPFVAASILTIPYYSPGGNLTEIYILPFACCCIYSFLRARRNETASRLWLVLAGMSAGVAGLFKPVGIASLLAITFVLFVDTNRSFRSRMTDGALTWAGCLLVWGNAAAYFALHGAAREMADASVFYNLQYGAATHRSILGSFLLMADRLSTVGALLGCTAGWFLFWLWPKINRQIPQFFTVRQGGVALLLFLWLTADLCGARAGGRYYPHYFLSSLPSMIVVSCISIDVLVRLTSSINYSRIVLWILLIPIGIAGLKGQMDFYHSASGNQPDEWSQAGRFIRDHKNPSDVIFTWEFRPGIYRLADSHTLTRWDSAHYIDDFPAAYKSIGSELMAELRSSPPNFIVYDCNETPSDERDTVRAQFLQLLRSEYRLVYRTGSTCVSER